MFYFIVIAVGYFLGSIPFGYLTGKIAGVDIRAHGSGNIGATNVTRVLGRGYGYAVFLADAMKGLIAVLFASRFGEQAHQAPATAGVIAAIAVVVGHSFPVWLRFKGGKGVATAAGACLGLVPVATIIATLLWCAIFWLSRYVSLASIVASVALPLAARFLPFGKPAEPVVFGFLLLIAALIVLRHRGNIVRLMNGAEPRFERK